MTTPQIILFVSVFVVMDLTIIGAVIYAASGEIREFAIKFPAKEPRPDAVRREFQSFKIGIVGLGGCIHVAVDEDFLHLSPAWFARAIVRMKPVSIPWDKIESKGPRFGRFRVQVENTTIVGPTWCFEVLN